MITRMRRVVRSRTAAQVVAASSAGVLIVGMAAAGATTAAATTPQNNKMMQDTLYPQTTPGDSFTKSASPSKSGSASASPSSSSSGSSAFTSNNPADNQLSVTVGKAVSITTDAAGTPSLKAFVLNTQVSGEGTGKLIVPVGSNSATNTGGFGGLTVENNSIIYNIDSEGAQVQNLHASGGVFPGTPAVSVQISTWIDGKPVNPNDMYNITGNVDIEYKISNNTARSTPITYVNTAGETVTTNMDIPVPFGASFAAVFGNGWGNIVAPWADTGVSPTGQELDGTAILFPPLGANVTTLKVTARADNATLPSATITAIPINLGQIAGGAILNILPGATSGVEKINGLLGSAPQKLVFYQQMIQKYVAEAAKIDSQTVNPLVKTVESINITSKEIDDAVDLAADAVDIFSLYVTANQYLAALDKVAATDLSKAFITAANLATKLDASLQTVEDELKTYEPILNFIIGVINNPEFSKIGRAHV